jgi:uncharacterized protein (DUF1697 family)
VCLLRAVNLGSYHKVHMAALREALTGAGFGEVRTYVQSGNVVLTSRARTPSTVASAVRQLLIDSFAVDTPVLVRTPAQLRAVAEWDPFAEQAAQRPSSVHVLHLDDDPDPDALAALIAADWGDDRVAARGHEIVIAYGESMHDSRLQHAALLRRLSVTGTARNWRTLLALVDLS